jgi:hypothetical protein
VLLKRILHPVPIDRLHVVRGPHVKVVRVASASHATVAGYVAQAIHDALRYYALTWGQHGRDNITAPHTGDDATFFKGHHCREGGPSGHDCKGRANNGNISHGVPGSGSGGLGVCEL